MPRKYNKVPMATLLCLLLMALVAGAQSGRVALIKVKSGSATLAGKPVGKVQMANQGDKLVVSPGSEVRIQLLGSSAEVTVNGPKELVIDKKALLAQGNKVTRGGMSVAKDIGSLNTVGASITRAVDDTLPADRLVNIRPILPPVLTDGEWVIQFEAGDKFELAEGDDIYIEVSAIEGANPDKLSHTFDAQEPLVPVQMPQSAVEVGKPYRFKVISHYGKLTFFYDQSFRILTPEQADLLEAARKELEAAHGPQEGAMPLIRLASLYQDLDQYPEALKYLRLARESEYLTDPSLAEELDASITRMQKAIDLAVPVAPVR